MKKLLEFLSNLFDVDKLEKQRAEAYLAQSVDLYDLEYRERQLNKSGHLKW